jgi:hypothetical protein
MLFKSRRLFLPVVLGVEVKSMAAAFHAGERVVMRRSS